MTSTEDRFWSKVDIDKNKDCWTWGAAHDGAGYGMFRVGPNRVRRAHRVAWELANNTEVPDGTVFLHSCDNPPCVNPGHVRPGTYAENAADRDAKGRWRQGAPRRGDKLDEAAVRQIRAWVTYGFTQTAVAEWFGVTASWVCDIVHGKAWGRVA